MKVIKHSDLNKVSGGTTTLTTTANGVIVKVTDKSEFYSADALNGHYINAIIGANDFKDLNGLSLGYDLSQPFTHNGHLVTPQSIKGGHSYTFTFNKG